MCKHVLSCVSPEAATLPCVPKKIRQEDEMRATAKALEKIIVKIEVLQAKAHYQKATRRHNIDYDVQRAKRLLMESLDKLE